MANSAKSNSKLRILYAEGDSEVLAKQAVTIEQAGAFDLVILGPTLTKNDRHHLAYMVKKAKPGTRVLVTHTDGEGHPAVDATLETGRSMNALLEKIASMYPQAAGAASGR